MLSRARNMRRPAASTRTMPATLTTAGAEDLAQQGAEVLGSVRIERGGDRRLDLSDRPPRVPQRGPAGGRHLEGVGAAVGGVSAPLDQALGLELVDDLHDHGAAEPQLLGDALLRARAEIVEHREHAEVL